MKNFTIVPIRMFALMNNYKRCFLIVFFLFLVFFSFTKPVIAENNNVLVEFFYSSGYCEHCEQKKPIVDDIEAYYGDNIIVERLPVDTKTYIDNYNKMIDYDLFYPCVVVSNISAGELSKFSDEEITKENLMNIIDYHLAGNYSEKPPEKTKNTTFCIFGFCFDVSQFSLPVLTIAMAFLDSFNPCAFFILIFLLNLLLYVRSRRRMLLIGGIFIFFSGFIYFLLMSAILNVFLIVEQQTIITIIAGAFALVFGGLNIKDFFFFKQGPSLGISEEKKLNLFQRMRKIVRASYLPSVIIGTIVLAIFANTYELLCSLGFPLVYTTELASHNIGNLQYYLYLIFYNVIYVIPLIVLLLIFVIKLGGRKLTEWQGRILKLVSGIMMFSLGTVLLIHPELLKNVFAALGIILISIISTILISILWKKIVKNHDINNQIT